VLDSQPQETLAELAQQGLERCQLAITAAGTAVAVNSAGQESAAQDSSSKNSPSPNSPASTPETAVVPPRPELPELLRDPFLKQQPSESTGLSRSIDETRPTAMPWLDAGADASMPDLEPEPKLPVLDVPQALPEQAAENSPEPELAAEPPSEAPTASEPTPTPTPAPTSADTREPATESATDPTPKPATTAISSAELDPAAVLAGSLLRVTIQPRSNNDSEATPLDRPADSLLLRLWQRLSGRR